MNIFLTGGTGFIGSHFLSQALEEGHYVKALKRTPRSNTRIPLKKQPDWIQKSMSEIQIDDLKDIDVIVHLAAHSANVPYDTLENCVRYNVLEPLKLFNMAANAGVKKIVVAGSCFEYGKSGERYEFIPVDAPLEPTQTYPASKAMASIAFHQFGLEKEIDLSILRIFQVFGDGELESRLWPSMKKAALAGEDFPMTKGEQIRDFIEVTDVARHFLEECKLKCIKISSPKIFNIGSGKPKTILEFSTFWWQKWEAKGELLVGAVPYRDREVFRYVPLINIP